MEKFKKKSYAIPSVDRIENNGNYRFIRGNRYQILEEDKNSFIVKSEYGIKCYCRKGENNCAHLQHIGTWEIT